MTRKLTTQQFREKLKKTRGNSVILLSKYDGSTNPVMVRFMPCGHKRTINRPYNLLNGSKCPICSRRQKTTEEFKQEVYDLVGNEYTVNSKYNNARTKINIIHNKCGYKDWWVRPSDFLGGLRCPKCSNNTKKTQKKFEDDVKDLYGDEYTVTGKYVDSGTPVEIRHNVCGHRWSPTPNNFLAGHSHCTECRKLRLRKLRQLPHKEVLDRIKKLYNSTIQILNIDDYDNSQSILEYHCTVCGQNRKAIAGNLLNGHGCANCANQHRNDGTRLNIQEVAKRIYDFSNGTYEYVSGDYEKNTSDIVVRHLECNQEFHTTWLKFSQGATPCPNCRGSFGEQQIKGYLQLHKIRYYYGYLIPGLKAKRELHFDFWIPQYKVAIEYDGQQHFRATDFAGRGKEWAKRQFEKVQKHDQMKNVYCKEHGIKLIRIPYTLSVNQVLGKELI